MPPSPQQQGTDNHMAAMWIVIGLFVIVVILWYLFRVPILNGILEVKRLEAELIYSIWPSAKLASVLQLLKVVNGDNVTMRELLVIVDTIGFYLVLPSGVLFVVYIVILFRKNIASRFRSTYSMKTLLKEKNANWPQTSPILGVDLVNTNIEQGVWAMGRTPMQFAKEHGLLLVQKQAAQEGALSRDARLEATLIKSKATEKFVKQLGPIWRGPDALNIHTKALYAVFAARANNDVSGASKLLASIAASSKRKKIDFTGVKELLEKHRNAPLIQRIKDQHAFVLTMMATMLELARTSGVQASADFLWLKSIDRRLWFVLNGVGRRTPSVEVAGVFSHWLVEKRLQRKIVTPMIDEAVKGLEFALSEMVYREDD